MILDTGYLNLVFRKSLGALEVHNNDTGYLNLVFRKSLEAVFVGAVAVFPVAWLLWFVVAAAVD